MSKLSYFHNWTLILSKKADKWFSYEGFLGVILEIPLVSDAGIFIQIHCGTTKDSLANSRRDKVNLDGDNKSMTRGISKMTPRLKLHHYFILSALAHTLVALGLVWQNQKTKPSSTEITIDFITKNSVKQQVVEQSRPSINKTTPSKSRFLSRNNQTVTEETQAVQKGKFRNSPHQKRNWAALTPRYRFSSTQGDSPTRKTRPTKPSANTPSQMDDSIKGVKKGLQTLLNTREFVYYSYYSRIRQQLRQRWESRIREKFRQIYRSGRQIASTQDHVTKVLVILNTKGHLVNVQILGPSGVRDLDSAAVEAFRAAAPFPNPPKGIANPKGQIQIPWEFVVEA